jgi:hypothetical protein
MTTDTNQIYQRIEQAYPNEDLTEEKINLYLTRGGKYNLTENQKDLSTQLLNKHIKENKYKFPYEDEEEEQPPEPTYIIPVHSYKKNGHNVKPYARHKPVRFTESENEFISKRKRLGLNSNTIINQYRNKFKGSQRTDSSLKTKYYRL